MTNLPHRKQQLRQQIKTTLSRLLDSDKDLESKQLVEKVRHFVLATPKIKTVAGLVSPIQVSAEILRKLAGRAEISFGSMLDGAVITVPAYFDDAQRQATKDAATLAGIKVLRLFIKQFLMIKEIGTLLETILHQEVSE